MMTSKPVILNIKDVGLSDEQFFHLCQFNEVWKIEQSAKDELIIFPGSNLITGNREAELLSLPITLSGEDVLPEFILEVPLFNN
jgi:hypothetical protein